jgi:hypothetical protein
MREGRATLDIERSSACRLPPGSVSVRSLCDDEWRRGLAYSTGLPQFQQLHIAYYSRVPKILEQRHINLPTQLLALGQDIMLFV